MAQRWQHFEIIVFATLADPVASGLVARLDRPGGNITGFANLEASLGSSGPPSYSILTSPPFCARQLLQPFSSVWPLAYLHCRTGIM